MTQRRRISPCGGGGQDNVVRLDSIRPLMPDGTDVQLVFLDPKGRFGLAEPDVGFDYLSNLDETRPFLSSSRLGDYLAEHKSRPSFSATEPPAA